MNVNINEYVELLLKVDESFETKFNRISTIKSLIKGAREFSGRNLQTGVYEKKDINEYDFLNELFETKRLSGLISYLILLEIIGSIFQSKKNVIKTVLIGLYFYFQKKLMGIQFLLFQAYDIHLFIDSVYVRKIKRINHLNLNSN